MSGLQDTNVVDLVAEMPSGEVILAMVEERPWGTTPDQAEQLREKINTYAGFVLDGSLLRQYPEVRGRPIHFRLDCRDEPRGDIAAVIHHATSKLAEINIAFTVNIGP